ncbi:Ryncolin-2 [Holothuria leucospilota]|uniref:Ryncolin-2 n=1 Tax=Holothuria leucospilota TaxID=206669 RepID=A0A9Q1BL55_HOLLE|nr:Ryncolin-2 [Holothuria leucospilota]
MASLQKKSLHFAYFLVLGSYCLAQQMGNPGPIEGNAADTSYFFYQRPVFPKDCQEVYHQCSSSQNASGVYLVKPDGLSEPFEVFCDNIDDSAGWTTILRRIDGSLDFNRNWAEYQTGFGFISTEFWLGHERLSYMVNQKKYELRIDIMNSEGTFCYLTYDNFRISDGWGAYKLVSLGQYNGTADLCIICPSNMEYGSCSCQATCEDPRNENGCTNVCYQEETCVCQNGFLMKGGKCVLEEECGCFLEGQGVIKDGGIYINSDCNRRCTCNDNQLTCEDLVCSTNATCQETNGSHHCQCNQGLVGDGKNCYVVATDCLELYNAGVTTDGVYTIFPTGWEQSGFEVYCEMESNGGGWTVFQRRVNGSVDFYRNWTSYKEGFGMLTREFWLGNDKIHTLTQQRNYQLRIDALNSLGGSHYQIYSSFRINDENDKYRLSVGTQSGDTVGHAFHWNNGQPFSTYDQDNDDTSTYNCAEEHRGAWWYKYVNAYCYYCWKWPADNPCLYCTDSNLNGDYQESGVGSIFLYYSNRDPNRPECGLTQVEMKLRPI